MPSYYLIEQKNLSPPRPERQGLPANPVRIGFLDFLRELEQEEFSLTPYKGLLVEGLEDVLLASRPDMEEMANNIRKLLQRSASNLQDKLVANVQIVFRSELVSGDEIWVRHPAARLPIARIFGSPAREEGGGVQFYRVSFNLSSGP